MTKEEFIIKIQELELDIDDTKLSLLSKLCDELITYNNHTNLTALKTREDIYLKHFYDSLTLVNAVNLNKFNNLLDVGTGAGFPGLVLKIFFPHLSVTLMDSNNKKTKWLAYISEKLNLEVVIINDRIENFAKNNLNKFDVVTARAVANLRVLSELCLPLVRKHGLFCPLKGNIEQELQESKETLTIFNAEIIKVLNFKLYDNNGNRNILVIKKNSLTESSILRSYDKIVKKPLKKVGK